ncbi:hydrogenase accessory protein HypB [Thermovirga lienii DSM 17291]|jgi:hydrogenase nickel incorporation protein HypB|uniref:Hydrogenase accessory protein HypB n=1 Tax=Thermovirga lienii (strain ATCC BAA-1197 / DSM 17291 / Cas60314) TaxID=580340 RepID=G7V5C3_THELD|nr:hydrogenase nickel incorporation protein HypB [Thermovirga lienii]AER66906.1 hydrogenase accessory protein HypB [Thermovirga lienii DSM 17291]KUK43142.1 MAG: Hydrogenase accessory protein HypB [Thermovirga lienii]MDN5318074.1 hydrogenase nickel incorporation protein HypB [Thermovirga sp.]HCD71979.1 hydrogenase accessory protein HypB [Thermovirga lienii]
MSRKISVRQSVFAADERYALKIREMLKEKGILMLNIIGSPGAGKTTLLEATIKKLPYKVAVIEGDVATSRDAERITQAGAPAIQINTQGGCHLEAHLVWKALQDFSLDELDIIFVENVGNLVCPAEFDLGEDHKVAVCSVPEGPDKPLKYPHLFYRAGAVLLTKVDFLEHFNFDRELFWGDVRKLNPHAFQLEVASPSGIGMDAWSEIIEKWLVEKRR